MVEELEELIGHVIRILNDYEIVIDVGEKDGAELGDEFIVYEEGEEILDLDGH